MEALHATDSHEMTLDPKEDIAQSPVTFSAPPAISTYGRGCCQQSLSPISIIADGWFPAVSTEW
jgi:hypothetical protein